MKKTASSHQESRNSGKKKTTRKSSRKNSPKSTRSRRRPISLQTDNNVMFSTLSRILEQTRENVMMMTEKSRSLWNSVRNRMREIASIAGVSLAGEGGKGALHVMPNEKGWTIISGREGNIVENFLGPAFSSRSKGNRRQGRSIFSTKKKAIDEGKGMAKRQNEDLVVHSKDGPVEKLYHYHQAAH